MSRETRWHRTPVARPLPCSLSSLSQDFVLIRNTNVQAARLGNIVHAMITYRRKLDREDIKPVS